MTLSATPGPEVEPSQHAAAYSVRVADLHADQAEVLDLWRAHLQLPPEARYEWFYLRHPCDAPTLMMLTHGQPARLVGLAALGTRRVCVQGKDTTAGILADLVVLPEHRTLYPALLLQRQMKQTAFGLHGIVYGIPNKRSTPIVRRLGYTKLGELIRYSKVLRCGKYLEGYLPSWLSKMLGLVVDRMMPLYFKPYRALMHGWECKWIDAVDERFDALWQRAREFNGLIGSRDAQFLQWRFLSQPDHHYRLFVVMSRGSADISAYAVCEAEGDALHVRDFLAQPSRQDHLRVLIHLLGHAAYNQGFSSLSLEFQGSQQLHRVLVNAGLMERSKRSLYAAFGPQEEARLSKLDWYVTGADEDQ